MRCHHSSSLVEGSNNRLPLGSPTRGASRDKETKKTSRALLVGRWDIIQKRFFLAFIEVLDSGRSRVYPSGDPRRNLLESYWGSDLNGKDNPARILLAEYS